jgi:uncharacterized membrane protein SirB2
MGRMLLSVELPFLHDCALLLAGLAIIPITRFFYFLRVLLRACWFG